MPAQLSRPAKPARLATEGTLRYLQDRRTNKTHLAPGCQTHSLEGVSNPDFLALGLGGTNLMAMLWTVAMGKRAVGVELRGDPSLGVHWNIREDLYHQLGLIDQMMLLRYGEDNLPKNDYGKLIKLADCFYSPTTVAGDVVADEVIDGYDSEQHIVGTIHHVEFIDDRWRNGVPTRTITDLPPPKPPVAADPLKIRSDMHAVLDGPSTFQASALTIQLLLRRYLDKIEEIDINTGAYPRLRLFTQHRVMQEAGQGFIRQADGRMQVRIEEVTELDIRGKTIRLRTPGSEIIDMGVPELFSIAQGAHSADADGLGFRQHDVQVDHNDGRGPVTAQADYIAGLIELLVDGRLRRRIASDFDKDGNEYWVRQIAVGHERDPEVGWVLVQVPDYLTFDPIESGLVAAGTAKDSPEYYAAYQILLFDFYVEQAALVLGVEEHELRRVEMVYGPKLFTLVERCGDDALVAPNGVVAGDTFGNGHFMTSAGAMTGMIGHSFRFLSYWQQRAEGMDAEEAIRVLADQIKDDTEKWLGVSAKEFTEAVPINFGAERGAEITKASGIDPETRVNSVNAGRRTRHNLLPLDPGDWRRLFVRVGKVISKDLPPINPQHPEYEEWAKTALVPVEGPAAAQPTPAVEASRPATPSQTPEDSAMMKKKMELLRQREELERQIAGLDNPEVQVDAPACAACEASADGACAACAAPSSDDAAACTSCAAGTMDDAPACAACAASSDGACAACAAPAPAAKPTDSSTASLVSRVLSPESIERSRAPSRSRATSRAASRASSPMRNAKLASPPHSPGLRSVASSSNLSRQNSARSAASVSTAPSSVHSRSASVAPKSKIAETTTAAPSPEDPQFNAFVSAMAQAYQQFATSRSSSPVPA